MTSRVRLQERQETLLKIYVFAVHTGFLSARSPYPLLRKLPGHHIFEPREV